MALIGGLPRGAPVSLFKGCQAVIEVEIAVTKRDIKDALWQVPADTDEAKILISKLFGLQIASGERAAPKLKPPVIAMRGQGRGGSDASALLAAE